LIKLGKEELYAPMLQIMARIVRQQRGDKNKVYSLHEPAVSRIAKGKAHKKYAFGSKVSVASLSGSNVVVSTTSFVGNPHDGKTLATTLDQVAHWTGQRYARVLVDKVYRGHGQVGGSAVIIPGKKAHASAYALRRHTRCCKHRSAIEAITEWVETISRGVQETRIMPYWQAWASTNWQVIFWPLFFGPFAL
jgi:transposase, IS5 family